MYDSTDVRDLESSNPGRQKVEWWFPGLGERERELLYEFGFCKMKRVLEMDTDDSFITMREYLKMVKMANFTLCVFYHN